MVPGEVFLLEGECVVGIFSQVVKYTLHGVIPATAIRQPGFSLAITPSNRNVPFSAFVQRDVIVMGPSVTQGAVGPVLGVIIPFKKQSESNAGDLYIRHPEMKIAGCGVDGVRTVAGKGIAAKNSAWFGKEDVMVDTRLA